METCGDFSSSDHHVYAFGRVLTRNCDRVTYPDAQDKCTSQGMRLSKISTIRERRAARLTAGTLSIITKREMVFDPSNPSIL
jgi:hypothetical protein